MLHELHEQHPGWYFVAATLLPLAAFLLMLLASALWAVLRPYREHPAAGALYNLLGGDVPGRGKAYVALAAIAGAFVLSFIGFLELRHDQHRFEDERARTEANIKRLQSQPHTEEVGKQIEGEEAHLREIERSEQNRQATAWSGRFDWLRVAPAAVADRDRGTVLQLGFYIDHLAALMFVMVTFVASLIHLFSVGYMSDELEPTVADHQVHTETGHLHRRGRYGRFFMFLSLFCFSMLNLVLADNLFQVFVSWELVGICSYLLIGFYYERTTAANAANKAFITNRVGDAGFIVGLLILWTYVGTFNMQDLFRQVRSPETNAHHEPLAHAGQIVRAEPTGRKTPGGLEELKLTERGTGSRAVLYPARPIMDEEKVGHFEGLEPRDTLEAHVNPGETEYSSMPYWLLVAAGLGIFLGCVGKSAQFPLQVWLPDAMEGPTPVSALIHAATMVAAGVYLVGRCYPLFTAEALLVIAYTGGITLFVAATVAVVMTDIKKVLAYSTVSQLGYMMLALGVGGWVAGLFHLFTHAFFKALLFLGSGSVIYGCHHEQDMLKMGGLYPKMKVTAWTMLSGVLAIAGIPLFTGWYSKDSILAQALGYATVHREHMLLFLLPLVTAGLTTFYMFRMWYLTFAGTPRDEHVYEHAHESPWTMTLPLVVLGVCSLVVAWGWPVWDAQASWMEHHIHHAQPVSVRADFGHVKEEGEEAPGVSARPEAENERVQAHHLHGLAGGLALGLVALGILFATLIYEYRVLDPGEAKEQFPGVHAFLTHKWYFDELYSAAVVRPALVVAHWCKAFDLGAIDGLLHAVARGTVWLSKWDGRFDNGIVDGLVNLVADTFWSIGGWLRGVQTGYLRSYVLFLVLAAVGIFIVLSWLVTMASAG